MRIDYQIIDEKLQYDSNREAAKISAWPSNKFNRYKYFTGKDILPSNQKQMIEQAKFTYSPLGKTFEEQIKTIEDQEEKQIKTIQNQGQVKTIKYTYDDEVSLISKQKEIFNELVDEITKLDEKVNHDDLIYRYKGKTPDENFGKYDNALNLTEKIKNGKIKLADVKNDQTKFKSNLSKIKREPKKSKEQKYALYNTEMLYETRNKVIKFYQYFFNGI